MCNFVRPCNWPLFFVCNHYTWNTRLPACIPALNVAENQHLIGIQHFDLVYPRWTGGACWGCLQDVLSAARLDLGQVSKSLRSRHHCVTDSGQQCTGQHGGVRKELTIAPRWHSLCPIRAHLAEHLPCEGLDEFFRNCSCGLCNGANSPEQHNICHTVRRAITLEPALNMAGH